MIALQSMSIALCLAIFGTCIAAEEPTAPSEAASELAMIIIPMETYGSLVDGLNLVIKKRNPTWTNAQWQEFQKRTQGTLFVDDVARYIDRTFTAAEISEVSTLLMTPAGQRLTDMIGVSLHVSVPEATERAQRIAAEISGSK